MSKAGTAPASSVEVSVVRTRADRKRFLELPYVLYKGHPYWVPPLRMAQKDILDTNRHPFYRTAEVEMFLAMKAGRCAGRIMAIENRAHNEFHGERVGFFGFFESEDDSETAAALFDAARAWLRKRGAQVMRGPVSPSTNYELGLLVEGFDLPPAIMMPYNPSYYVDFFERYGFKKAMDLYAFKIDVSTFITPEKLGRVVDRLKKKDRISVRQIDLKKLEREIGIVRRIYNDAWSKNWGFVPVTEEEFNHLAKDLKQLADPAIAYIAEQEKDGSAEPVPIGFFLAVPDVNLALKKINGRLLPFGLPKLLWHSRKIDSIRIITMGIVKEHQNLGVASVFYDEIYRRGPAKGYIKGELSWILENNVLMIRAAELFGCKKTKTYRIYEMPLD